MTEERFKFYQDIYETIFIEDMQGENIRLANEEDMSVESGLKLVDLLNAQHKEIQYLRQLLDIGKTNAKDLIDVLNDQEQEKARLKSGNEVLKKTLDDKNELLSKTLTVNSNYEKCLKEMDDVLAKHNIHTLEKLDQVLTNERTW